MTLVQLAHLAPRVAVPLIVLLVVAPLAYRYLLALRDVEPEQRPAVLRALASVLHSPVRRGRLPPVDGS